MQKTAELLNVSEGRVRSMLKHGEIQGLRIAPETWLVDAGSLYDYVRDGNRRLLQVFRQPERSLTAVADE